MKHPLFIRAANIAKFGGSAAKVVITKHGGELYVIKHWLMSDVWDFLLSSGADAKYPLPSYIRGGYIKLQPDVISGLVNKNPGLCWFFLLMRTKRPKRANRRFVNHLDWR
jgi:hypothetical protein